MVNIFAATDEFLGSLDVTEQVGHSLTMPEALKSSQLLITNAISCATVVLISGYFENFLKNLVKEYIEAINGLGKPLSDIPFDMRLKHFSGGADALVWTSKEDKLLKTTLISQDLSRRLASLSQPSGYILAWEAFANTKSNPGTETVKTILSGLEVEKAWTEINDLQKLHGRLDTFLTSFIKMRNVCAHTGRHSTPPSGVDIVEYVDKFRALAECIDTLTAIRLEVFATP
jgi:hypothetical protein